MKWHTCTPVAFKGDHTFFCRDFGAFCRAFQQLGIESKAILPLPVQEENGNPDVIRTEYKNLESAEWWKSLGIDGLVLYAWGMGKYTPMVKAARDAGIFVVTFMDTSGIYYPWKHWAPITSDMWYKECYQNGKLLGTIRTLLKIIKKHSIDLPDWGRKNHFKYASLIAFPLPEAINSIKNLHWLYGKEICNKLITITNMIFKGFVPKEQQQELWDKATAYISPSLCHEAGATAILEALGRGRPVIAYAKGAACDHLANPMHGWLMNPDEPNSLKQTLLSVLQTSSEQLERIGQTSRSFIKTNHSSRKWIKQFSNILHY